MKTVVITGASAGVGRATAHAFARRGANVALLARDAQALDEAAREIRECGSDALPIALDVADADALDAAAARVERELGPIDVWVNNAMATVFAPFDEIAPADFARATTVTYLGCVYGTRAALERMRPRDSGTIVQVGSALAYRSIPLQSAYCGAKHAIRGFTDALRCELLHAKSRVHLTMVQLPAVDTPQFDWAESKMAGAPRPLPPVYAPEVAADAIVDAAERPRRERWIGFSSIAAIAANALVPQWLDRYLARTAVQGQQRESGAGSSSQSASSPSSASPRPSNLWTTVPGAHATHGAFGDEARHSSVTRWAGTHRGVTFGAALAVLACALAVRGARR